MMLLMASVSLLVFEVGFSLFVFIAAPYRHEEVRQEAVRERGGLECVDHIQAYPLMKCAFLTWSVH